MQKLTRGMIIVSSLLIGIPAASFAAMDMNQPSTNPSASMAATNARPNLSRILQSLNTAGYPVIKSVALENGVYEIKAINYLAKPVKFKADLNGNIISKGTVIKPISLTTATQMLEAQGYQVQEISVSGKQYVAKVLNTTGEASTVKVDAENAMISS